MSQNFTASNASIWFTSSGNFSVTLRGTQSTYVVINNDASWGRNIDYLENNNSNSLDWSQTPLTSANGIYYTLEVTSTTITLKQSPQGGPAVTRMTANISGTQIPTFTTAEFSGATFVEVKSSGNDYEGVQQPPSPPPVFSITISICINKL